MVYQMELTYDEIVDILNVQYIAGSTIGCTLVISINEFSDINLMLKSLLPNKVKANIAIDDIILKSKFNTNKTIRFTKKSFFYTILGFNKPLSGS